MKIWKIVIYGINRIPQNFEVIWITSSGVLYFYWFTQGLCGEIQNNDYKFYKNTF